MNSYKINNKHIEDTYKEATLKAALFYLAYWCCMSQEIKSPRTWYFPVLDECRLHDVISVSLQLSCSA